MGLKNIDNKAASKGSGIETVWQFVKFIVVSLAAFAIQSLLPALIQLFMSPEFKEQSFSFLKIFHDSVNDKGEIAGLGVFIAATVSNIIAQIVAFFINKEKTFNSNAKVSKTLPIYLVVIAGLICMSAALTPKFVSIFTKWVDMNVAAIISGALCGMIQFFILFPIEKILFRQKKETTENAEVVADESAATMEETAEEFTEEDTDNIEEYIEKDLEISEESVEETAEDSEDEE